jgi:hypothetical protein
MIKQIQDFNPFNYEGYFFLETNQDIEIEFFSSNGYLPFEDYDIYRFDNFSIIAFHDMQENVWITNFRIQQENSSNIIQGQYYERVKDSLEGNTEEDDVLYIFLNSLEIKPLEIYNNVAFSAEERCDFNKFGPHSFYPKIKQDSVRITGYKNVLSVTGTAHISRLETESLDAAYSESTVGPHTFSTSRTFSGLLKAVSEWKQTTTSPWNNTEDIAVKSLNFLNELNINEEDLNETLSQQCDMRVSRYIKGEDNLAKRLPENTFISEGLNQYFRKNFRYRTLKNIKELHPNGNLIPSEMIEIEDSIYGEYISYYCLTNSMDYSTLSLGEIYEHVGKQVHYTQSYMYPDRNNSVTDVIQKMLGSDFYE